MEHPVSFDDRLCMQTEMCNCGFTEQVALRVSSAAVRETAAHCVCGLWRTETDGVMENGGEGK